MHSDLKLAEWESITMLTHCHQQDYLQTYPVSSEKLPDAANRPYDAERASNPTFYPLIKMAKKHFFVFKSVSQFTFIDSLHRYRYTRRNLPKRI